MIVILIEERALTMDISLVMHIIVLIAIAWISYKIGYAHAKD